MIRVFLQVPTDPIEATEMIFGFMIAIFTQMGIYGLVVGAVFGVVVLGLSFRLIDAIGGKG